MDTPNNQNEQIKSPVPRKHRRTTAQRIHRLKERIALLEETNRAYAQALESIERIANNA